MHTLNDSDDGVQHSELLGPSSGILETRKHNVSKTGSVSVLRWGKDATLLGLLERAGPVIEVNSF
jgi:hypothetical protein